MEHVAVGIILRDSNVLISKRDKDSHQGGFWEFPGGKKENNESIEEALSRELKEELGILIANPVFIFSNLHNYTDKKVKLYFFSIDDFFGEPLGLEGQSIKWQCISMLNPNHFPNANNLIIEWLKNKS